MVAKRMCAQLARKAGWSLGILALLVCFLMQGSSAHAAALNAFVRVVHASPAAGPVDVFVDGHKLLNNFRFGTVTNYMALQAGAHKLQVTPTGKLLNAAVITQNVNVTAGVPYTVAAVGTRATGFSLVAFIDNNMSADGTTKVRVYHLSPNAGPVDVSNRTQRVITALTYDQASNYITVQPGFYTFNVRATQSGTVQPVAVTLRPRTINSVFALGELNGFPRWQFEVITVPGVRA